MCVGVKNICVRVCAIMNGEEEWVCMYTHSRTRVDIHSGDCTHQCLVRVRVHSGVYRYEAHDQGGCTHRFVRTFFENPVEAAKVRMQLGQKVTLPSLLSGFVPTMARYVLLVAAAHADHPPNHPPHTAC